MPKKSKNPEIITANLPSRGELCPYCSSKKVIKRGKRYKKRETIQLYLCKDCQKTFTPAAAKGKHYPLKVVFEAMSSYNRGYPLSKVAELTKEKYGLGVKPATIDNWIREYRNLCSYHRIRPYGKKLYSPEQIVAEISLYHRQIYKFRIHRAKLALTLQEEARNRKFEPLREFLESIYGECPHYLFKDGQRASELKPNFNMNQVIVREKKNFANRLAHLVLQSVKENKFRHEELQKFFLFNDSVTVATEVPVYLLPDDIEHMESQLNFQIPLKIEDVLTGHIDLIQIRNGSVYILDYKPKAAKENPTSQLTIYALALSRLTGLRLYDIRCAWFDEEHYFEFFPLHVVYKLRQRQQRVSKNQRRLLND